MRVTTTKWFLVCVIILFFRWYHSFLIVKSSESFQHNLKLLLYVGPHKTGSSTVELFLYQNRDLIANKYGYKWPHLFLHGGEKQVGFFGLALDDIEGHDRAINKMVQSIDLVLKNQNHLVLASEEFDRFNTIQKVEKLHQMITKFNVTVIMTYREGLNTYISYYNQLLRSNPDMSYKHKNNEIFQLFLSEYLDFKSFVISGFTSFQHKFENLVSSYGKVFGLSNIHIIDYYGILKANKDLRYIVTCEISKIMCNDDEFLQSTSSINPSSNVQDFEMIAAIMYYIKTKKGCLVNKAKYAKLIEEIRHTEWPSILFSNYNNTEPFMKKAITESKEFDQYFRNKYSANILYSNREHNIEALEKVSIKTIDRDSMFNDTLWIKAMNDFINVEHNKNITINCPQFG